MYEIKQYKDKFTIYELVDNGSNSWVKVCPERGGIIIGFGVNGKELLYLDKETFYDVNSNIRGGIPVLFPISGQLKNGEYKLNGRTYKMRNHGVARINPWAVIETSTDNCASIKLSLKSSDETRKSFPFDFQLVFTYTLKDGKLSINQEYINNSAEPMPMYAGFHPYFNTAVKELEYDTDACSYLDYNDMVVKDFTGRLNIEPMVESAILLNAKQNRISFSVPDNNKKICLEYGNTFKYIVLWSVKGKDFICVEPWMAQNSAFNTGEELVYVEPGKVLKTYFDIFSLEQL